MAGGSAAAVRVRPPAGNLPPRAQGARLIAAPQRGRGWHAPPVDAYGSQAVCLFAYGGSHRRPVWPAVFAVRLPLRPPAQGWGALHRAPSAAARACRGRVCALWSLSAQGARATCGLPLRGLEDGGAWASHRRRAGLGVPPPAQNTSAWQGVLVGLRAAHRLHIWTAQV